MTAAKPSRTARVLSFGAYQATWWACVLGAGSSWALAGVAGTALFALAHVATTHAFQRELALVLAATALGVLVDSVLVLTGAVVFPGAVSLGPLLTPLWMVALWTGFGATLSATLAWVLTSSMRAMVFGALAGPFAYLGGTRLGPMVIPDPVAPHLVLVAGAWAGAMVALAAVYRTVGQAGPVEDGGHGMSTDVRAL